MEIENPLPHKQIAQNSRLKFKNLSLNDLLFLLTERNSAMICLQETFLKENDKINIKTFESCNNIHNFRLRAWRGCTDLN